MHPPSPIKYTNVNNDLIHLLRQENARLVGNHLLLMQNQNILVKMHQDMVARFDRQDRTMADMRKYVGRPQVGCVTGEFSTYSARVARLVGCVTG